MDTLLQDIRYGLRQLSSGKAVSVAAILCIAIGIGANTTIFTVVNAMLLRPIAGISDNAGLLEIGRGGPGLDTMDTLSYPTWRDVIEGTRGIVEVGLWTLVPMALSGAEEPEVLLGFPVSPSYFDVLGLEPTVGRFFTEEEAPVEAAEALVVISHGLWQRRYGSDPEVVGRVEADQRCACNDRRCRP